jgi:creatinine amidohydrolase
MEMTWVEIKELDKEKTVIFITIAPIEEHSYHLPLGTDIYEGERWQKDTIEILSEKLPDYNFLYIPSLAAACAGVTAFTGNIHYKQSTVRNIVYETLENIVSWDMKNIIVIASHGDPTHLIAVEESCTKINKKYGVCAFSPMGSFFSAKELGLDTSEPKEIRDLFEKYPNDFHAGWVETSCMMDINSSLVRDNYKELPDNLIKEKEMMFSKKVLSKMAEYGHLGYPRISNKQIGILLNQNLSLFLSNAVAAFINRKDYEKYLHHALYKIPFLRTTFLRNLKIISGILLLIIVLVSIHQLFG